jgi:hypothetical protein
MPQTRTWTALALSFAAAATALPHRSLEESTGTPNCQGCYNRTSGQCLVDGCGHPGACSSCTLATAASCKALGLEFMYVDGNVWPTGCLAQQTAKCEADLAPYEAGAKEKYTVHANTTEECLAAAQKLGATHAGLAPCAENEIGSFDCDAIFVFKGASVWAGWQYYALDTMEMKTTCGNFDHPPSPPSVYKCVNNKCIEGIGSLNKDSCHSNCGPDVAAPPERQQPSPLCLTALNAACAGTRGRPCQLCTGRKQHELKLAGCTHAMIASYCDGDTPGTIRAGSWNVYYHALDDTLGRAAIIDTIDSADAAAPFDFFGVVEAQGDISHGP